MSRWANRLRFAFLQDLASTDPRCASEFLPDRFRDQRPVVLESGQAGPQRAFARRGDFMSHRIVVAQVERAQQRPEREPLDRERAEHDREGGQHDQVAKRKRRRQSASAAASVTMPRMPDHEMTRPLPTVGRSIGRGG